jgi:CheY-like chemotaxis protein
VLICGDAHFFRYMNLSTRHGRNRTLAYVSLTWVTGQGTFALSLFFGEGYTLARKILLADDSVTAQNMGRKILTDAGYDVVTVNNGSAALKRVAELKPDLIVLDVYMPGYSGLEVCQRLKDSPDTERLPVLLTVGKLEPFKPEEARRVKADAYIIKPFEASELLTALARMEDRMVPGQAAGSRFGDGGSRKSEGEGDADTGWKNRLRFPSKKKKEEPEPDPEELLGGPSFRNFRRGKSKAPSTPVGKAVQASPEPSVVPDIPRDITPEELDALSALAAKLDSPAAGTAEKSVAPAVVTEEKAQPAVEPAPPVEAKAEFEVAAPAAEEKRADEVPSPQAAPQAAGEAAATNAVPEASAMLGAAEPVAESEVKPTETVPVETLAAAEPAPVDRSDGPIFAAPVAVEPVPQKEKIEVKEIPAASSEASAAANPPETIAIQPKAEELKLDEPKMEAAPPLVEAVKTEEAPAAEVSAKIEEAPKTEATREEVPVVAAVEAEVGPAPSEEELAEALRLLTPAFGHADASSMPTRETLAAAGAMLAEEAARNAAEAPRWVAAAVPVSPEEAALSLEAEMFQTVTGMATGESTAPVAPATASPAAESEPAAEVKPEIAAEAPAEAMAAVPTVASGAVALNIEQVEAEPKDVPAEVAEEAAEEPMAATFADAVQHDEVAAVSEQPSAELVIEAAVLAQAVEGPAVETMEGPPLHATEDEEAMAKERAKAGKSSWHQIRTGSPAAATQDVVEAAKQAEPVEEAPKAMAAAAAADSAPAAVAASDPNTIASIVDSVLADLRPKIVEEIAKKLAGK